MKGIESERIQAEDSFDDMHVSDKKDCAASSIYSVKTRSMAPYSADYEASSYTSPGIRHAWAGTSADRNSHRNLTTSSSGMRYL